MILCDYVKAYAVDQCPHCGIATEALVEGLALLAPESALIALIVVLKVAGVTSLFALVSLSERCRRWDLTLDTEARVN